MEQEHLQLFDLTLTTWAPLFIGSGKKYVKKDYLFNPKSKDVSFLDEQRFFSFLLERNIVDAYEQFILGSADDLWYFLTKDCKISSAELKTLVRYKVSAAEALDDNHSLKDIYAFQRDALGRAYVPGSSLKGALRTVWLLNSVLDDPMEHTLPQDVENIQKLEARYIHQLHLEGTRPDDAVNSLFRGILVSDSQPISDKVMVLAGKQDVSTSGLKKKIPLCRESVGPGAQIRFKLTLDQSILQNRITKESLEQAIQRFDRYYKEVYQRHFTPPVGAVSLPEQNHLILGGGSGFFSKSLVYPYLGEEKGLQWTGQQMSRSFKNHHHDKDRTLGISPHTMKYTAYCGKLYPYGFCGVSIT